MLIGLYESDSQEKKQHTKKPKVAIASHSTIIGNSYIEGYLTLHGKSQGSIYTHGFETNRLGSRYMNYLYNAHISPYPLKGFSGVLFAKTDYEIAQWLY